MCNIKKHKGFFLPYMILEFNCLINRGEYNKLLCSASFSLNKVIKYVVILPNWIKQTSSWIIIGKTVLSLWDHPTSRQWVMQDSGKTADLSGYI